MLLGFPRLLRTVSLLASAPAALLFAPFSRAETAETDEIEEIVVTADAWRRPINEFPVSVTVIPDDVIEKRNAQHLEELFGMVPNLNYSGGSSRARFFQIRGVGDLEQFDAPLNSSVGVILDDVDFSGAATISTLFDVEQVEVLRGPQGTRYGANALAGLIKINTKDPTEEFEASLKVEGGELRQLQRGRGGVRPNPRGP